jgi:glycosyltransferase involved in cell wall biosynthesis
MTAWTRSRPARILHAPTNVAGIAGLLARAQRDLGFDATSVQYARHAYGFGADRTLGLDPRSSLARKAAAVGGFALRALARYDVFHFYFGHTLLPSPFPDLPLLRALGKRVVFHFCGCDVRDRAETLRKYDTSACAECTSRSCLTKRRPRASWADAVFVSTPDLLEFVPGARVVPGPIDLAAWPPRPPRTTPVSPADPVRIVHAPSDREKKGTRFVVDAVGRLARAGYPVELLMLEGVPHDQVAALCRRADIGVDQLLIGAYGTAAVEMMASGLPVVCRIREDLRPRYPADLPVVSAGPHDVFERLDWLIRDPERRADLGRRGVAYVRREHEMHAVAGRVLAGYGIALPAAPIGEGGAAVRPSLPARRGHGPPDHSA